MLRFIYAIGLLSTDLGSSFGVSYLEWIVTVFVVGAAAFTIVRTDIHSISTCMTLFAFLSFLIMIGVIQSSEPIVTMFQALKVAAIGIIILPASKTLASYKTATYFMYLTALCLLCGLAGVGLAWDTGNGRWATIFNYPGSLYKIAIMLFPVFFLRLLVERRGILLVNIVTAFFIIVMDGSRTAIIVVLISVVSSFWYYEKVFKKSETLSGILFRNCSRLFLIAIICCILVVILKNSLPIMRIEALLSLPWLSEPEKAFYSVDSVRGRMIVYSFYEASSRSFMGTFFGATKVDGIVIHNAYLQIMADLGLIGFALVTVLYISPLVKARKVLKSSIIRGVSENKKIEIVSASIGVISFFIYGLFHPFSTQVSDWSYFLFPASVIFTNCYNQGCSHDVCKRK